MLNTLSTVVCTELKVVMRRPQCWLYSLVFFMISLSLFPLAFGADPVLLHKLAPGCIWLSAVFASLVSMENLFQVDLEDGALEQMCLAQIPLATLLFIKISVQWLATTLPLILLLPIAGWIFTLSTNSILLLALSLLLGTSIFAWIAALGVALTVGLRHQGSLLGMLVLPLITPVLIFAVNIILQAEIGLNVIGPLYFIAGLTLFSAILMPFVLSAVLQLSLDE